MRIRKSGCIELDGTHCCIRKFNVVLSLCGVLGVTLYFSEGFLKAVVEALQLLEVTMVCFLGQGSNLWSSTLQQRYRLFLRCFLHLLLVNLPLLASLEEKSICRELDCFFGAENKNGLKENVLADKATRDEFVLFWEAMACQKLSLASGSET